MSMPRKKILIVDDQRDALDADKVFFNASGHDVRTALTCEDGLKVADEAQPDLLIIEYRLSGIGGLGFVQRIRQKYKKMGVIVMTTGPKEDIESEFAGLNVFKIFEKPLSLEDLLEIIRKVLKS